MFIIIIIITIIIIILSTVNILPYYGKLTHIFLHLVLTYCKKNLWITDSWLDMRNIVLSKYNTKLVRSWS